MSFRDLKSQEWNSKHNLIFDGTDMTLGEAVTNKINNSFVPLKCNSETMCTIAVP